MNQTIKFLLFSLVFVPLVYCEYNKFQYTNCDTNAKGIAINKIDVVPMPIIQPGLANFTFNANVLRAISGPLATQLNIIRTVSGLTLPVKCYLTAGVYVGSCNYTDLCTVVEQLLPQFNPKDCPPTALAYGIDCTCPFKLRNGLIDLVEPLDLPDASQSVATFLASGDFDITIKTSDPPNGNYACVNIKFTVKPASTGK